MVNTESIGDLGDYSARLAKTKIGARVGLLQKLFNKLGDSHSGIDEVAKLLQEDPYLTSRFCNFDSKLNQNFTFDPLEKIDVDFVEQRLLRHGNATLLNLLFSSVQTEVIPVSYFDFFKSVSEISIELYKVLNNSKRDKEYFSELESFTLFSLIWGVGVLGEAELNPSEAKDNNFNFYLDKNVSRMKILRNYGFNGKNQLFLYSNRGVTSDSNRFIDFFNMKSFTPFRYSDLMELGNLVVASQGIGYLSNKSLNLGLKKKDIFLEKLNSTYIDNRDSILTQKQRGILSDYIVQKTEEVEKNEK